MPNQGLRTIVDHKLVFIANFRAGNFHRPVTPSLANGLAVSLHWLILSAANTSEAKGAQTRKANHPGIV